MTYVFVFGPLAVTSEYWEETYANGASEGGARVELRRASHDRLSEPVWRADLFSLMGGKPGSHDRAHYHPRFHGWEGGARLESHELRSNPVDWTLDRLNDLATTLRDAGVADLADQIDPTEIRAALPEIRRAVERCMRPPATDGSRESPILVPVRASGSGTPLFFLTFSETGLPGLHDIAESLGARRPLYGGAVSRAIDDQPEIRRIREVADVFLEEIRKVRPKGPYVLAGSSAGGLVAYEVASRLRELGEDVPLLVLVDTVALHSLPAASRVRMARNRSRAAVVSRLPDPVRNRLRRIREGIRKGPSGRDLRGSSDDATERPPKPRRWRDPRGEGAIVKIVRRYRPRPYYGRIVLLRTKLTPLIFEDFELGWGRLARAGIEVAEISGFHGGVMRQPYVWTLGESLAASLQRAGV